MNGLQQLGSGLVRTWWFWAFVLLATPNCAFNTNGLPCDPKTDPNQCQDPPPCDGTPEQCDCDTAPNCPPKCPDPTNPDCTPPCPDPTNPACSPYVDVFKPGNQPQSDAIMCDIPEPLKPGDLGCATQAEVDADIAFSQSGAATALATGQGGSSLTFDWSPSAQSDCAGLPKKVKFLTPYPKGLQLCLNCTEQITNIYATTDQACAAKCEDLINLGMGVMPADVHSYCLANAHTSTNFDKTTCYHGACTSGGNPNMAFVDPRTLPENVVWTDFLGTTDDGGTNNLRRNVPTTGQLPQDFNAGGASAQLIKSGDAWVEFSAAGNTVGQVLSLRHSTCDDVINCPDQDPSTTNMEFGLSLFTDMKVYVVETLPVLLVTPTNFQYSSTDRFRIKAKDLHNGTAEISFWRLTASCTPGTMCPETLLYTSPVPGQYPLRVDTSIRDENATLTNVTLVRIQQ